MCPWAEKFKFLPDEFLDIYNGKGCLTLPKQMNFRKNSKRPLTPPHFQKIMLQIELKKKNRTKKNEKE